MPRISINKFTPIGVGVWAGAMFGGLLFSLSYVVGQGYSFFNIIGIIILGLILMFLTVFIVVPSPMNFFTVFEFDFDLDDIIFFCISELTGFLITYFLNSFQSSFLKTLAIVVTISLLLIARVGVLIFTDIINKKELFELDSEPRPLLQTYMMFASQARSFLGKSHVWIIPKFESDIYFYDYKEQMNKASSLYSSIQNNLEHTPVSRDKKAIFKNQANKLILNINKTLWKRFRTKRLYGAINHDTPQAEKVRENAGNMIRKIELEVSRSLDILSTVSLSLLSVELAHGEAEFDRLVNILNHSNDRLQKISEVYLASKHYS